MLVYEVKIGEAAADVAERHMVTEINGVDMGTTRFDGRVVKAGGLRFAHGDKVKLTLRDVDAHGNHSEPAVCEFEALDTIAPAQPQGFGVEIVGEVPDSMATVHPLATVEGHEKTDGKAGEGEKAIAVELPSGGELPDYESTHAAFKDHWKQKHHGETAEG